MPELLLYTVDTDYVDFLRDIDSVVPKLDNGKDKRPFVGVVFDICGIEYFAPLTSYKEKFSKMRSGIDFILIEGNRGAINLNNMIPVHSDSLKVLKTELTEDVSIDEKKYRNLVFVQIEWCNKEENKSIILNSAKRLYRLMVEGHAPENLRRRCCDFEKLEKAMIRYCLDKGIELEDSIIARLSPDKNATSSHKNK